MDDGSIDGAELGPPLKLGIDDGMPLTLGSPEGSIEGRTLVDGSELNDGEDEGAVDGV